MNQIVELVKVVLEKSGEKALFLGLQRGGIRRAKQTNGRMSAVEVERGSGEVKDGMVDAVQRQFQVKRRML
jgi:flavin-binding protein dodecin